MKLYSYAQHQMATDREREVAGFVACDPWHNTGVRLICDDQPRSTWWLHMPWCQTGTWSSAATIETLLWKTDNNGPWIIGFFVAVRIIFSHRLHLMSWRRQCWWWEGRYNTIMISNSGLWEAHDLQGNNHHGLHNTASCFMSSNCHPN